MYSFGTRHRDPENGGPTDTVTLGPRAVDKVTVREELRLTRELSGFWLSQMDDSGCV